MVKLTFGANLNPHNIAEGNDVYFECSISANPEVYKVVWLHNVSACLPTKILWDRVGLGELEWAEPSNS